MARKLKTVRLNDVDYPVDGLSAEGLEALERYRFVEERLRELRNTEALLTRARNAYIADLKDEILRARTGLDFSDLLSGD